MERIDPDKFRPLVNLLKDRVRDPRHSIIELLGWLIDFNPRPHALWERKDNPSLPPKESLWVKFKTKKAMIYYTIFLVVGIGF